jgi:hypothetical protein
MFLPAFIEDLQRLSPPSFLAAVDLPKVQHRALHNPPFRSYATVLHHPVVAVKLAVFLAYLGAQKHASHKACQNLHAPHRQ